ncbi:MAG: hypothetical protein V4443_08530 [Pseudomonadota bacterium]
MGKYKIFYKYILNDLKNDKAKKRKSLQEMNAQVSSRLTTIYESDSVSTPQQSVPAEVSLNVECAKDEPANAA